MLSYQRTTAISGLICLFWTTPVAQAEPPARRSAPRMSGPKDKPVAADSRYPASQPRPNGALLSPLPPTLRLKAERIRIQCRYGGGGCAIRHEFEIRNTGDATTTALPFVSPRMAVLAEVDGRRAVVDAVTSAGRPRRWSSSGVGLDPGSRKRYKIGGRRRLRVLRTHRVQVSFPARGQVTVALITNSVGGFDRFRRPRTQPEVAFSLTRRKNHFVHHHELPLTDPAARRRPRSAPPIAVHWILPAHLRVGANVKVRCKKNRSLLRSQICTGRITTPTVLRWAVAERHRRPVGFFLGAGIAFTHRGVEALLRGGVSLMLRSRRDLLTLSAETDAQRRFALALVYQLFLPYSPHNWEMGPHFELGMVLDLVPKVRPAIRAGATLHISMLRVNLLFDLYPGELKKGGGPSWRGMAGVGIGF